MLEEHTGLGGSMAHGNNEAGRQPPRNKTASRYHCELVPVYQLSPPNRPLQCVLQSVWKLPQVKTQIW